MINVHSKALNKSIQVERIIGEIHGTAPGPTLVFFGGIHGNEPSGVFALHQVLNHIKNKSSIHGNVYALSGNLKALANGVRFLDLDLNRIWTSDILTGQLRVKPSVNLKSAEFKDVVEILSILKRILSENQGPFYFFDLHTTSSETIPFITINDTMLNRKFALHYPVPIILGIEEYVDGPLLSYINKLGYIALGFESGQHDQKIAIDNHIAFIYHSLRFTGVINENDILHFALSKNKESGRVFEIVLRHQIINGEPFKMNEGFVNFQTIKKGESLAASNNNLLVADRKGKIFMPLYQSLGDDGYFIVKHVPFLFLKASTLLRKIKLDSLLTMLPGIKWKDHTRKTLIVNLRVAKFLAKDLLHLMGYRLRSEEGHHISASKREDRKSNKRYKHENWLKIKYPPHVS